MTKSLSVRKALSFVFAAIAVLGLAAQKAYAHHVITIASVSCNPDGSATINYTVKSWDPGSVFGPPGDGDNPNVQVFVNGVSIRTGAFIGSSVPPDQFSGTTPFPQGTPTADVTGIAEAPWGDGYAPQQGDSNTVTLTNTCPAASGVGRFTGGGKQVTGTDANGNPVVVTKGFELDCDLHQPSNNLEINWTGGNHFHMESFNSAACSLAGNPKPPIAPVNTIIGSGTGRYNDMPGFTVVFELIDNGEPGKFDEAAFMVYETANPSNVVLTVPLGFIATGNVQAHVDQH